MTSENKDSIELLGSRVSEDIRSFSFINIFEKF